MEAPRIRDWPGPLDVGGLAADAVELARAAVERLARVRGSDVEVGTSAPLIVGAFDSIGHLRIDGRRAEGWAPLSGFVEAGDGWVRLHGNFPHHAQAICTSLQVDGPEDLARAVARLPCAEVEERVTAAGGALPPWCAPPSSGKRTLTIWPLARILGTARWRRSRGRSSGWPPVVP